MIASEGKAVGRHPMLGKGKRASKIGGARARDAVEAGLEGVAVAAAEPTRKPPIGEAAGQRHAHRRPRPNAIIDPRSIAAGARRDVMRANDHGIALGAVGAAIAAGPHIPAPLPEKRCRRCRRLLEDFSIGERNLGRLRLFRRKPHRSTAGCNSHARTAAIDQRIEHQREKLVA
jgi:hypothetical protein